MTPTQLNPCTRCGSNHIALYKLDNGPSYDAHCRVCRREIDVYQDTEALATEAWNQLNPLLGDPSPLEALREKCAKMVDRHADPGEPLDHDMMKELARGIRGIEL